MSQLGVFRDDYYNATAVLTAAGVVAITTNLSATVLTAAQLVGAQDQYLRISGQTAAQTATTDTAANIIAALQAAVQAANIAAGAPLGVQPPGVPNLTNVSYTLSIVNANTTSGVLTLSAGAGVTISGLTGTVAITATATYVVTVTSPSTVTLYRVS